jgi:hypothetical protein
MAPSIYGPILGSHRRSESDGKTGHPYLEDSDSRDSRFGLRLDLGWVLESSKGGETSSTAKKCAVESSGVDRR